jgi:hypothetical protein
MNKKYSLLSLASGSVLAMAGKILCGYERWGVAGSQISINRKTNHSPSIEMRSRVYVAVICTF